MGKGSVDKGSESNGSSGSGGQCVRGSVSKEISG